MAKEIPQSSRAPALDPDLERLVGELRRLRGSLDALQDRVLRYLAERAVVSSYHVTTAIDAARLEDTLQRLSSSDESILTSSSGSPPAAPPGTPPSPTLTSAIARSRYGSGTI